MKYFIGITFILLSLSCGYADNLDDVLNKGTLRVGVSLYEPWVMQNKDGELYGYEIQVAEQLAKDLAVQIEFNIVEWEDLIDTLKKNNVDVIISGMAITPERALKVNYSDPYGYSGVSLAANIEKTKNINSLLELNASNVFIGVVSDSVSESVAKKVFNKASIKSFSKSKDAVEALLNSEIHALIEASPVPKFLALEFPSKVDAPLTKPLLSYKAAMAVNKGEQEFLNYLNSWITAREAEGWLPAKHKYWFETLDWKK
jgi:polar amino acid transport system substrate-binding protein